MKTKFVLYSLALGGILTVNHALATEHHKALTDTTFATKAAAGGLTEVQLGQLAQQNGGSQDVKDFGAKMVTDHGKANDSLKAVATKDSLTIPDKPNADQQALIDKLSKETGPAFDKAYIHAMVKAHIGDKALFAEEIDTAKNPDLKQFATDTLPVIKEHLSMIEAMAGSGSHHTKKEAAMDMSPAPSATPVGSGPGANGSPQ